MVEPNEVKLHQKIETIKVKGFGIIKQEVSQSTVEGEHLKRETTSTSVVADGCMHFLEKSSGIGSCGVCGKSLCGSCIGVVCSENGCGLILCVRDRYKHNDSIFCRHHYNLNRWFKGLFPW